MNKLLISKDELRTAIIEAVRAGGETKVFINSKGSIFTSNASESSLEAGGMDIIETISVKSYGDLNYDNAEDFIEEDADFCYLDDFESDNIIFEEDCEFGSVEFEGKKYILAQQAYVDNANGTDGDVIYTASAEDAEGNKYKVVWETTKDFDDSQELHHLEDLIDDIGMEELTEESQERYNELIEDDVNSGYCEDESNACDWDSPASVTKI